MSLMPVDLVSGAEEMVNGCKAIHEDLAALYRAMPTAVLKGQVTEIRMKFAELLAGAHEQVALCQAVHRGARVPAREIRAEDLELHPNRQRSAVAASVDGKSRAANDHTLD